MVIHFRFHHLFAVSYTHLDVYKRQETDFVAKNAEFQGFVEEVANQAADSDAADMDAFMAEAWAADPSKTVKDALEMCIRDRI